MQWTRESSFVFITATYVFAALALVAVFAAFAESPILAMLWAMVAATGVTFAASLIGNGSVFDAYWSVIPPLVFLLVLQTGGGGWNPLTISMGVVLLAWAVRLTLNWARGWTGFPHEDWRYPKLYRESPLPRWLTMLLAVEIAPTIFIWLGCLPIVPATRVQEASLGPIGWLALAIGLAATLIEWVADEQMRSFGRSKQPGDIMDRGLWRYSRHPNYFGELLLWFSLWLFALAADSASWWSGIGIVSMIGLFAFISIPLLEQRSHQRRPGFSEYAAKTSVLIPWFPRK
jgi:steroid 5-alpha reductase family enzyme